MSTYYGPAVDHPPHYNSHPSGIEAIQVTEHMSFNLGNAMKYLWRAGQKGSLEQDLRKAIWYIEREIARLARPASPILQGEETGTFIAPPAGPTETSVSRLAKAPPF